MKTLLISGGSMGIGKASIAKFLAHDYRVFNLDIVPPEHNNPKAHYINCDVSSVKSLEQAIAQIKAQAEQIDVLVCNAGIHFSATIEDTSYEDYLRVFNTNFQSAFFLTKLTLPLMTPFNKGAIIYIGSDQSLIAKRNSAIYGATKAALASLAKTTAVDYAKYGIRSNLIAAGTIETPLYHRAVQHYCDKSGADINLIHQEEAALQPLGRLGQPIEVGNLIYFLASDEASFITGAIYPIDGGYTAI